MEFLFSSVFVSALAVILSLHLAAPCVSSMLGARALEEDSGRLCPDLSWVPGSL